MKKSLLCVSFILSLMFLSGCWDKMELEDRAYVVVLGLDKNEKDNFIDVTFQIANPQTGSSARGDFSDEPPSDIVTITTTDVLLAKDLANSIVTRRISFKHLDTLIISEELARSDFLLPLINSMIIEPEIRHRTSFIVTKESAHDFIHKNQPAMETRPHKYYEFMRERWKDIGFVPYAKLIDYFQHLSGGLFLAAYATTEKEPEELTEHQWYKAGELPQKSGDPVQMIGSAVFKNGKMIDTLNGVETRIALSLRNKSTLRNPLGTFKDPLHDDYYLTVHIVKSKKIKINFDLKKDPIQINVYIPFNLHILTDLTMTDYATDVKKQQILKESLTKQFEENTLQFIKRTQKEFKGDPFKWHTNVRKYFPTVKKYNEFNWEEKYQHAQVNVTYDIELISFGGKAKPSKADQKM